MTEAKRRLSQFDFSGDDAAIALVHKGQGSAANGYKTLITKATDVTVELSMAEFLHRFTDMWYSEAQMVARMLGYSDTMDAAWDEEELEKRVSLMKSAKETGQYTPELLDTVAIIAKAAGVTIKDTDGGSPVGEVSKSVETPKEDINMSDKQVEELQKALDAKAEREKELEQIQKSLQAQVEEFQKKEQDIKKAQFVEIAKGYSVLGVGEEQVEATAVALMKAQGDEQLKPLLDMIEKGQKLAENIEKGVFQEQGHNVEVEADMSPDEKLAALIQKSKESK